MPYVGIRLSDLTFIDEANPTLTDEQLLSGDKVALVTREIGEALALVRSGAYALQSNAKVRELVLASGERWDENELYRLSRLVEPRSTDEPAALVRSDTLLQVTARSLSSNVALMTDAGWDVVRSVGELVSFDAEEVIVEQDELVTHVYRIERGRVGMVFGEDGSGVRLKELPAGSVFCEVRTAGLAL